MKKFIEFINELKSSTYRSASKKLKELGHTKRSEELDKHNEIFRSKIEMNKYYGDLMPFELICEENSGGILIPGKKNLVTAYLSGWAFLPSIDNDCESCTICPVFLYNTKQLHIEKTGELNKEHIKGLDATIEIEYIFQLEYSAVENIAVIYSFEGKTKHDYIKFSNRRDAVRFKKILEGDTNYVESLVDMLEGCDDISPFSIQKKFIDAFNINIMYSEF